MSRLKRDEVNFSADGLTISTSTAVVTMALDTHGSPLGAQPGAEGITTSTISRWLRVRDNGTTYFIPMWT